MISHLSLPQVTAVAGKFTLKSVGTGIIDTVEINGKYDLFYDQTTNGAGLQVGDGFHFEVGAQGMIGNVEIRGVSKLAVESAFEGLVVSNTEGHVGNILVVGVDTGLSIGGAGIILAQNDDMIGTSHVGYNGMVMIENIAEIAGGLLVSTSAASQGFLAGISLRPSTKNFESFGIGGNITILLESNYCRSTGILLNIPQQHQPRYQNGPRVLINSVSSIGGSIVVESNGGSCLSDVELVAAPAFDDVNIEGGVSVFTSSDSKSPGGINVFRVSGFQVIKKDVVVRAEGTSTTVASIIRTHIDAQVIAGTVHVSTNVRGVVHNAELWQTSSRAGARLERIGGDLIVGGVIGTAASVYGTSTFEIGGNVTITATGYKLGEFDPRGKVIIPSLHGVQGSIKVGHTGIVPEVYINTDSETPLIVNGSVAIGSAHPLYNMGVPMEGQAWEIDADLFVGPTVINGLASIHDNLEIVSNLGQSEAVADISVTGSSDGFTLGGFLKMVAIKGAPERSISISGLRSLPTTRNTQREIYQVRASSFGDFRLNGVLIDQSQIPPVQKKTRDAFCLTKCKGNGFVGEDRGSGCSNRNCTCFDGHFGQYCGSIATLCQSTEYESVALSEREDRSCASSTLCNVGERQMIPLTATADRMCISCPPETFQLEANHSLAECVPWTTTPCEIGEVESAAATATSDRVCTKCGENEFATINSNVCHAVQTCDQGEVEVTAPTLSTDRVCMACQAGEFASGKACKSYQAPCQNGMFENMAPTVTNDRECLPCPDGTYQDKDTVLFLGRISSCQPWSYPCTEGFAEQVAPTRFVDRVCIPLPTCEGGYLRATDIPAMFECIAWTTCSQGTYQSLAPTADADRECKPCPTGTFQDLNEHQAVKCKPWSYTEGSDCPRGTYEHTASSTVSDRICLDCSADTLDQNGEIPYACLVELVNNEAPDAIQSVVKDARLEDTQQKGGISGTLAGGAIGALAFVVAILIGVKYFRNSQEQDAIVFEATMKTNFKIHPNGNKSVRINAPGFKSPAKALANPGQRPEIMKNTNFKINPKTMRPALSVSKTPVGVKAARGNSAEYLAPRFEAYKNGSPINKNRGVPRNHQFTDPNTTVASLRNMPGASSHDLYEYMASPEASPHMGGHATMAAGNGTTPQYAVVADDENADNCLHETYLEPTPIADRKRPALFSPGSRPLSVLSVLSPGNEDGFYTEPDAIVSPQLLGSNGGRGAIYVGGSRPNSTDSDEAMYNDTTHRPESAAGNNTDYFHGLRPSSANTSTLSAESYHIVPHVEGAHVYVSPNPAERVGRSLSIKSPNDLGRLVMHRRRSTKLAVVEGTPIFRRDLMNASTSVPDSPQTNGVHASHTSNNSFEMEEFVSGFGADGAAQCPTLRISSHPPSTKPGPQMLTAAMRTESFERFQENGFAEADADGLYGEHPNIQFQVGARSASLSPDIDSFGNKRVSRLSPKGSIKSVVSSV
jgi:hypothetical protein